MHGRLALAGLRLADLEPGPPLAELDRLDVRFDPRALLRGHVWIREATLGGARVRIVRSERGEFNIADLLKRDRGARGILGRHRRSPHADRRSGLPRGPHPHAGPHVAGGAHRDGGERHLDAAPGRSGRRAPHRHRRRGAGHGRDLRAAPRPASPPRTTRREGHGCDARRHLPSRRRGGRARARPAQRRRDGHRGRSRRRQARRERTARRPRAPQSPDGRSTRHRALTDLHRGRRAHRRLGAHAPARPHRGDRRGHAVRCAGQLGRPPGRSTGCDSGSRTPTDRLPRLRA